MQELQSGLEFRWHSPSKQEEIRGDLTERETREHRPRPIFGEQGASLDQFLGDAVEQRFVRPVDPDREKLFDVNWGRRVTPLTTDGVALA